MQKIVDYCKAHAGSITKWAIVLVLGIILIIAGIQIFGYSSAGNWHQEGMTHFEKKEYDTAFDLFKRAANYDDTEAQFMLGICYLNGYGTQINIKKAVKWFEEAAENEHAGALYELGFYYENNTRQMDKAVEYYNRAADLGNADALYMLGCLSYRGIAPVTCDYDTAKNYFQQAADKNHARALYMLGVCYEFGTGVEQNVEEARKLYEKSVAGGCERAAVALRCLDGCDHYYKKEYTKAFEIFKECAEQKNVKAEYMLAKLYENGWGVEKNVPEAFRLYQTAAERGHLDAIYALGEAYEYGYLGVTINLKSAKEYYQRAADRGHTDSQYMLGCIYYNGSELIARDRAAAVKYFLKAADQNHARAQYMAGRCYELGTGVEKNMEQAEKLYQKAAAGGSERAKVIYDYRKGLEHFNKKEYPQAFEFFTVAAKGGNPDAQFKLGQCCINGWGCQKNPAEGVRWYDAAAKQDHLDALYEMGLCYEYGKYGVSENLYIAKEYYLAASDLGHLDATYMIGWLHYYGKAGLSEENIFYGNYAPNYFQRVINKMPRHARALYMLGMCFENGKGVLKDLKQARDLYQIAAKEGHEKAAEAFRRLDAQLEAKKADTAGQ